GHPGNWVQANGPPPAGVSSQTTRRTDNADTNSGGNPTLEGCRRRMLEDRLATLGKPGLYHTGGPAGCGKTTAAVKAIAACRRQIMDAPWGTIGERLRQLGSLPRSLTTTETHGQCDELVDLFKAEGLPAVAYPRLGLGTCARHEEATAVINRGLSFRAALC